MSACSGATVALAVYDGVKGCGLTLSELHHHEVLRHVLGGGLASTELEGLGRAGTLVRQASGSFVISDEEGHCDGQRHGTCDGYLIAVAASVRILRRTSRGASRSGARALLLGRAGGAVSFLAQIATSREPPSRPAK
jgi:hypothetical protein